MTGIPARTDSFHVMRGVILGTRRRSTNNGGFLQAAQKTGRLTVVTLHGCQYEERGRAQGFTANGCARTRPQVRS